MIRFGYHDAMFSDTVRIAWENYWCEHDHLIVVACGSVSSWIKENIIIWIKAIFGVKVVWIKAKNHLKSS